MLNIARQQIAFLKLRFGRKVFQKILPLKFDNFSSKRLSGNLGLNSFVCECKQTNIHQLVFVQFKACPQIP
jgi:hypothetical protein